jgi:exonuclease VII small subunit
MKQSEKLAAQIQEAKTTAQAAAAEIQKLSDDDSLETSKVIDRLEKLESRRKAALLVLSNLEPKLTAALNTEAREAYNKKRDEAKKALEKYIAALEAPYGELKSAITMYAKAMEKAKAAKDKALEEMREQFVNLTAGARFSELFYQFSIEAALRSGYRTGSPLETPDLFYGYLKGAVDKNLKAKKAEHLIPSVLAEMLPPFENPEPAPVFADTDSRPMGRPAIGYSA